jgi:DNA-directed RNA polymerase alpha subunit
MMDRLQVAPAPCPDCRGKGQITLLVSVQSCARCHGTGQVHPLLDRAVDDLELSIRSRNILRKLGVQTVGQLIRLTPAQLHGARNSNALVLKEVQELLARLGLGLRGDHAV